MDELKRLLTSDALAAEAWARQALTKDPNDSTACFLLGAALHRQKRDTEAKAVLEPLVESQPQMVATLVELGTVLYSLGKGNEALTVLSRAVDLAPQNVDAWFALSDSFRSLDADSKPCGASEDSTALDEQLSKVEVTLSNGSVETIEGLLRRSIGVRPTDCESLKDLAETLFRSGRQGDAEAVMQRCVELIRDNRALRFHYTIVLCANGEVTKALHQLDELQQCDHRNMIYRILRAFSLARLEQYRGAIQEYESILEDCPRLPGTWWAYGRALRAVGRHQDCASAILRSIEILPGYDEAYCLLAGVKSFQFGPSHIDALRLQLARPTVPIDSRAKLHFALGKALEDTRQFDEAFDNYRRSHQIRGAMIKYDPNAKTQFVLRSKSLFKPDFLASRTGCGHQARDPIFIVGMPRSGSTLIEQILSCHSAIEGLGELLHMNSIAGQLDEGKPTVGGTSHYPEVLQITDGAELFSLGQQYLELVRPRRKLGRPFFTDKLPGNHSHIGLLHLILPNARIIDARRHPLDCGLSCFKSYFPFGQDFSHSLKYIGQYYTDYVELMAHYDEVLPGKVHRVIYEQLIAEPEKEVRKMLDYLGLPFEEGCLRFYEKDRPVTSLSSEQVRAPIYKSAVAHWCNFEEWLQPLRQALGYIADAYPSVPVFYPRVRATTSVSVMLVEVTA